LTDGYGLSIGVSLNDIGANMIRSVLDVKRATCVRTNREGNRASDQGRYMHLLEQRREVKGLRKIEGDIW
jgi:hypothetical protein